MATAFGAVDHNLKHSHKASLLLAFASALQCWTAIQFMTKHCIAPSSDCWTFSLARMKDVALIPCEWNMMKIATALRAIFCNKVSRFLKLKNSLFQSSNIKDSTTSAIADSKLVKSPIILTVICWTLSKLTNCKSWWSLDLKFLNLDVVVEWAWYL